MTKAYGTDDATYQAAGGEQGLRELVERFYFHMDNNDQFKDIRELHPDSLDMAKDKLARFLCGWSGGPKLFHEKYGDINIPRVHVFFEIGEKERDDWLSCMQLALNDMNYADDLKVYLMQQLSIPAERIRAYSEKVYKKQ